jgi:hypothetical protein
MAAGRLAFPPCPFKALTGLACATCGLTRCVRALAAGNLREAFHWHPVAVLLLGAWGMAALWDLDRARRGAPYPELPDSGWARAGAAALLLGTWVLQAARHI